MHWLATDSRMDCGLSLSLGYLTHPLSVSRRQIVSTGPPHSAQLDAGFVGPPRRRGSVSRKFTIQLIIQFCNQE